jgi:hypothetical protein
MRSRLGRLDSLTLELLFDLHAVLKNKLLLADRIINKTSIK